MMKVIIQEKFNTTMGLIIQVKNDRIFKIGNIIKTDDSEYKINKIMFSSNPEKDGFVNLLVSDVV